MTSSLRWSSRRSGPSRDRSRWGATVGWSRMRSSDCPDCAGSSCRRRSPSAPRTGCIASATSLPLPAISRTSPIPGSSPPPGFGPQAGGRCTTISLRSRRCWPRPKADMRSVPADSAAETRRSAPRAQRSLSSARRQLSGGQGSAEALDAGRRGDGKFAPKDCRRRRLSLLRSGPTVTSEVERAAIRLLAIRETPLSVDEVLAAVSEPAAGGVALFVGTIRDHDGGRPVTGLEYSAHPTAVDQLRAVAEKVSADYPVCALAAVHRIGSLAIGDLAVVVGVACPHRAEAFAACHQLIDELKVTVPIWKRQLFADGIDEWVGSA